MTEITAPAPLSSVIMLKDGHTLVGGGADGKTTYTCSFTLLITIGFSQASCMCTNSSQ